MPTEAGPPKQFGRDLKPHAHHERHRHNSLHRSNSRNSHNSLHRSPSRNSQHSHQSNQRPDRHSHSHSVTVEQPLTPEKARKRRRNCLTFLGISFIGGMLLLVFGALTYAETMGSDESGIPLLICGCFTVVAALMAFLLVYFDVCQTEASRVAQGTVPRPSSGADYQSQLAHDYPPTLAVTKVPQTTAASNPSPGSTHPSSPVPTRQQSPSLSHSHAQPPQQSSVPDGGEDAQESLGKPLIVADAHP